LTAVHKALIIGGGSGSPGALGDALGDAGIDLVQVGEGGDGLRAFYAEHPDIVVLDLELPDTNGLAVLQTIRELSDVPIVAVTEEDSSERVRGLRAGADDCVSAPVSEEEMSARIEALLRRARRGGGKAPAVLADDFLRIDHARHRVEALGVEVSLTPIEFRMLASFAGNPGQVLAHGQLLDMVWGDRIRDRDEVKLYVCYLRRKLGAAARLDPVETVRGVGYRYAPRRIVNGTAGGT
jgi:DNA-binding response OmpR family regulator